jgi:hypothetical protein
VYPSDDWSREATSIAHAAPGLPEKVIYGTRVVLLLPFATCGVSAFLLHKRNALITLFAVLISVWLLRVAASPLTLPARLQARSAQ